MFDYEIATLERTISDSELIILPKNIPVKISNNSTDIIYLEVSQNDEVIKKHKIKGEEFEIYSDGINIILTHPTWSLSGIGPTLIEAERNLYNESKYVYEHYKNYSPEELTEDALKLREFLIKII